MRNLRQIQQFQALDASLSINDPSAPLLFSEARAKLLKTVKNAKREHYRKIIEELDHKTIFRAVKWPSSVRQYTYVSSNSTRRWDVSNRPSRKTENFKTRATYTTPLHQQRGYRVPKFMYGIKGKSCPVAPLQHSRSRVGNISCRQYISRGR